MTNKITKPHSFGIWGNTDKPRFWELLDPLLKWAEKKKMIPFITTRIKDQLPNSFNDKVQIIESANDFHKIDFLLTLGGEYSLWKNIDQKAESLATFGSSSCTKVCRPTGQSELKVTHRKHDSTISPLRKRKTVPIHCLC